MKTSRNNKHAKRRKKILKNLRMFVLMPFAVCALLFVLVFAVSAPFLSDAAAIGNMFLQNNEADYSTSYENIFTPTVTKAKTVDADKVVYPSINKQFGMLKIKQRGVEAKLFFGDNSVALRNGVGVYAGSFIPGYGKTILVAGHNNTFFHELGKVKTGDIVEIRTSYGNYKYKVKSTAVKAYNDKTAYDLKADRENLILYTCYPFDELGLTEQRFFVYADKISGPEIVNIYGKEAK